MKKYCISFLFGVIVLACKTGQDDSLALDGFRMRSDFDEQELTFAYEPQIRIYINAPGVNSFEDDKPVGLIIYALPNGNTIEHTAGKNLKSGDDWHYDIQHIAAQTRFIREKLTDYNVVVAYLEAQHKSWPAWKRKHTDYQEVIPNLVDSLMAIFKPFDPFLVLNGHSGGGSFIFGYLNSVDQIPACIKRIVFLDSNYGYDHTYGEKLVHWLDVNPQSRLMVLAYNDSIALYQGKRFVSDTGGTWYRSKMMRDFIGQTFPFTTVGNDSLIHSTALDGRIRIILKKNPGREIFHTVQVERNGFIHSLLFDTSMENSDYRYFTERAYTSMIGSELPGFVPLQIPPRSNTSINGRQFMDEVKDLFFTEREERIYAEISNGNIPDFLRDLKIKQYTINDSLGAKHIVRYQVMPDYLAIGSDDDYCRIPMGPQTAQKIADLFGASMPTSKLVDDIYHQADIKLIPHPYFPVGNRNETVEQFLHHSATIDSALVVGGGKPGQLIAGIKKDIILSSKISDPNRTHHVVIYGWHKPNGKPIQPVTNVHIDTYVDYSHGVRLINSDIHIDGIPMQVSDIIGNPDMFWLLSNDDVPINRFYNTLENSK